MYLMSQMIGQKPSTFHRAINAILSSALGKHALAYLEDDVCSKSFEDHLHLVELLDLLAQAGFRINVARTVAESV